MIVYSAPLGAAPLLPPAECLDISMRGARSIPTANGAWLAPDRDLVEAWRATRHRAERSGFVAPVLLLNGWRRFESAYRSALSADLNGPTVARSKFVRLLYLPRLYLLDDGDGRPAHASLPPCDPERTPRRVVRGVLVAMGAEDGGEWVPG